MSELVLCKDDQSIRTALITADGTLMDGSPQRARAMLSMAHLAPLSLLLNDDMNWASGVGIMSGAIEGLVSLMGSSDDCSALGERARSVLSTRIFEKLRADPKRTDEALDAILTSLGPKVQKGGHKEAPFAIKSAALTIRDSQADTLVNGMPLRLIASHTAYPPPVCMYRLRAIAAFTVARMLP